MYSSCDLCLYDHGPTLHSLYVVNFTGRTDRESKGISSGVCSTVLPRYSQISLLHMLLGFWSPHGYWLFPPVFLLQSWWGPLVPVTFWNNFGSQFPFSSVNRNKAFNILMGPKTVGPQRRTVKLFEVKIYLCGPQMTTFLFENVLLSCFLRMQGGGHPSAYGNTQTRGGYWKKGRNQSGSFLLSILQISFKLAFWWSVCLEKGILELQDSWAQG